MTRPVTSGASWRLGGSDTATVRLTAKILLEVAKDHVLPIAAKSEQAQLTRLGRFIASLQDRRFDLGSGLVVVVRRDGELKTLRALEAW